MNANSFLTPPGSGEIPMHLSEKTQKKRGRRKHATTGKLDVQSPDGHKKNYHVTETFFNRYPVRCTLSDQSLRQLVIQQILGAITQKTSLSNVFPPTTNITIPPADYIDIERRRSEFLTMNFSEQHVFNPQDGKLHVPPLEKVDREYTKNFLRCANPLNPLERPCVEKEQCISYTTERSWSALQKFGPFILREFLLPSEQERVRETLSSDSLPKNPKKCILCLRNALTLVCAYRCDYREPVDPGTVIQPFENVIDDTPNGYQIHQCIPVDTNPGAPWNGIVAPIVGYSHRSFVEQVCLFSMPLGLINRIRRINRLPEITQETLNEYGSHAFNGQKNGITFQLVKSPETMITSVECKMPSYNEISTADSFQFIQMRRQEEYTLNERVEQQMKRMCTRRKELGEKQVPSILSIVQILILPFSLTFHDRNPLNPTKKVRIIEKHLSSDCQLSVSGIIMNSSVLCGISLGLQRTSFNSDGGCPYETSSVQQRIQGHFPELHNILGDLLHCAHWLHNEQNVRRAFGMIPWQEMHDVFVHEGLYSLLSCSEIKKLLQEGQHVEHTIVMSLFLRVFICTKIIHQLDTYRIHLWNGHLISWEKLNRMMYIEGLSMDGKADYFVSLTSKVYDGESRVHYYSEALNQLALDLLRFRDAHLPLFNRITSSSTKDGRVIICDRDLCSEGGEYSGIPGVSVLHLYYPRLSETLSEEHLPDLSGYLWCSVNLNRLRTKIRRPDISNSIQHFFMYKAMNFRYSERTFGQMFVKDIKKFPEIRHILRLIFTVIMLGCTPDAHHRPSFKYRLSVMRMFYETLRPPRTFDHWMIQHADLCQRMIHEYVLYMERHHSGVMSDYQRWKHQTTDELRLSWNNYSYQWCSVIESMDCVRQMFGSKERAPDPRANVTSFLNPVRFFYLANEYVKKLHQIDLQKLLHEPRRMSFLEAFLENLKSKVNLLDPLKTVDHQRVRRLGSTAVRWYCDNVQESTEVRRNGGDMSYMHSRQTGVVFLPVPPTDKLPLCGDHEHATYVHDFFHGHQWQHPNAFQQSVDAFLKDFHCTQCIGVLCLFIQSALEHLSVMPLVLPVSVIRMQFTRIREKLMLNPWDSVHQVVRGTLGYRCPGIPSVPASERGKPVLGVHSAHWTTWLNLADRPLGAASGTFAMNIRSTMEIHTGQYYCDMIKGQTFKVSEYRKRKRRKKLEEEGAIPPDNTTTTTSRDNNSIIPTEMYHDHQWTLGVLVRNKDTLWVQCTECAMMVQWGTEVMMSGNATFYCKAHQQQFIQGLEWPKWYLPVSSDAQTTFPEHKRKLLEYHAWSVKCVKEWHQKNGMDIVQREKEEAKHKRKRRAKDRRPPEYNDEDFMTAEMLMYNYDPENFQSDDQYDDQSEEEEEEEEYSEHSP